MERINSGKSFENLNCYHTVSRGQIVVQDYQFGHTGLIICDVNCEMNIACFDHGGEFLLSEDTIYFPENIEPEQDVRHVFLHN